ncbi:hypothetical protein LKL48_15985, partial [Listeria monocytogenes]|nr:hypothetical protein [Listeria monocytogenes]
DVYKRQISNGANDFKPIDYLLMALSIPLFIILYKWSVYQEQKGNQPLIAPNLLKNNQFVSGMFFPLAYFPPFPSFFSSFPVFSQLASIPSFLFSGLSFCPRSFFLSLLPPHLPSLFSPF